MPAIAPLLSVIISTLLIFVTRADKHGVAIVRTLILPDGIMLFCVFYSFPFEAYAVCDIPKSLPPKVKSIKKGVNPSSADKIFFTGDYLGKGFKIGVVSGMVALTVKQNPRAQFLQQCSYRSVLFE